MRTFLLLTLVAAFVALGPASAGAADGPAATSSGPREVVAVFNFAQRDDDPRYAWLSKGLADLLINQLADLPNLSIVSRDRMQMLVSEFQRGRAMAEDELQENPEVLGQCLQANRVVFGTYAIRDGRATLTCQVNDAKEETRQWQAAVEGPYKDVLDLERELARRLKAHFLGQSEKSVPLSAVPCWTTVLGAGEHLYAGIDLFDRGEFCEAWRRFRLAARADPGYPDAAYWQARMFYYLTLYENATLLYETFLKAAPGHPRAGDAVLEWVDAARQAIDDPAALLELFQNAQRYCDDTVMVHNKTLSGRMPLNWYLEGLIINDLRHLGRYHEAFERAIKWDQLTERYRNAGDQTIDSELLRHGVKMAAPLANLLLDKYDEERFLPGMGAWHHDRLSVADGLKNRAVRYDFGGRGAGPRVVPNGGKYSLVGGAVGSQMIIAPPGYRMVNLRVVVEHQHQARRPGVTTAVLIGFRGSDNIGRYYAPSDKGPVTIQIPTPFRCRYLRPYYWVNPTDLDKKLFDTADHDRLKSVTVTVDLEPIVDDRGSLRVRVSNTKWERVCLDGQPIESDFLIRGVKPGRHEVTVESSSEAGQHSSLAKVTATVDVKAEGETVCDIVLPLSKENNPHGWQAEICPDFKFPDYRLPPPAIIKRLCVPSLLRVTSGPLKGRLVAVWSYREQIWMSFRYGDGDAWSQPQALPVPVNTASLQIAPKLIQAEDGRFCLAFLSDRGLQRALSPYVTWSTNLATWSAPRQVDDVFADDLEFLQDRSGRFLIVLPPPYHGHESGWTEAYRAGIGGWQMVKQRWEAVAGSKFGRAATLLLASNDLRSWTSLKHNVATAETRRVRIFQTADGVYHALTTEITGDDPARPVWSVLHRTSPDGAAWGPGQQVWPEQWGDIRNLTATTDGKRIYGAFVFGGSSIRYFEIDERRQVAMQGYTEAVGVLNTLYADPLTDQLHWLSGGEESWFVYTCRQLRPSGAATGVRKENL